MLSIRPYQTGDRERLMQIAADTAFFGQPIEIYMEDRRIFLEYFYAYYTDYEPQHAWVATADDQVVGFLTGCFNTHEQTLVTNKVLFRKMVWNIIRGKYKVGKKFWAYYLKLYREKWAGRIAYVNLQQYPAHLHINIDHRWRGYGIGYRLMQVYLDQLNRAGIPGVHLGTTSENETACRLYTKIGFELLEANLTRQWEAFIDRPIETRLYGLRLPQAAYPES
jgi:GNAT superfamily N-acetyltransferase